MSSSFASLNAGLLARKGEAAPSKDLAFGHKPWQPPIVAAPAPAPATIAPVAPQSPVARGPNTVQQEMKVRLQDVAQTWPIPRPSYAADFDGAGWIPGKPLAQLSSFGHPVKTTLRLTHAQTRALKLAALVLDKPQQEILTKGLLERLEALACSDLAKCSCFQAVIEGLRKPEPAAPVGEV